MKVKEMRLPFSRRGSYLVISPIHKRGHDSNALYIRMIRGGMKRPALFSKLIYWMSQINIRITRLK